MVRHGPLLVAVQLVAVQLVAVQLVAVHLACPLCHAAKVTGLARFDAPKQTARLGNMTELKTTLLANYDMNTSPPNLDASSDGRGVKINVQLALQQLTEIDSSNERIGVYGWWRHNWVDPRLAWDPADYDGIDFITFIGRGSGRQLWSPDDLIYESIEQPLEVLPDLEYGGERLIVISLS